MLTLLCHAHHGDGLPQCQGHHAVSFPLWSLTLQCHDFRRAFWEKIVFLTSQSLPSVSCSPRNLTLQWAHCWVKWTSLWSYVRCKPYSMHFVYCINFWLLRFAFTIFQCFPKSISLFSKALCTLWIVLFFLLLDPKKGLLTLELSESNHTVFLL